MNETGQHAKQQAGSSAPVEVTWYTPEGGANQAQRHKLRSLAMLFAGAVLLVIVMMLAGWMAGSLYRGYATYAGEQEVLEDLRTASAADVSAIVAASERLRDLHPESPEAHMQLAQAYMAKAKGSPQPEVYRQEALHAARYAWRLSEKELENSEPAPREEFARRRLKAELATVLAETGAEKEALEHYEELLRATSGSSSFPRALLLNNMAWLLVTAEDSDVRDHQRAHRLAVQAVKIHPRASKEASFLDTLALTYYSIGKLEEARNIQKEALALAEPGQMDEVLGRYDLFHHHEGTADGNEN